MLTILALLSSTNFVKSGKPETSAYAEFINIVKNSAACTKLLILFIIFALDHILY